MVLHNWQLTEGSLGYLTDTQLNKNIDFVTHRRGTCSVRGDSDTSVFAVWWFHSPKITC